MMEMLSHKTSLGLLLFLAGTFLVLPGNAQPYYYAYVASESADQVSVIRFDEKTATADVAKEITVGVLPHELEGPHGLTIGPEGRYWFLSLAHGFPNGRIQKFETGTDRMLGEVEAGLFPATLEMSAATGLLYVVNFNLHGDRVPSTISVIEPVTMTELQQVTQGVMPHGSRLSPDGTRHYSVAMMSGLLYEMDAASMQISRQLATGMHQGGTMPKPTWVDPHPTQPLVYVANNGSNEVVEVSIDDWAITRRFETGKAPYNLEVTPNGRLLVVSYKGEAHTGIWDLERGVEISRIPNSQSVTHGVAITTDSKYAFVSVEGVGGVPGTVDVIDLTSHERVASVSVGSQAGGIAFWKRDSD